MAKGDIRLARLFYEIEADSKGLKGELDAAERSFDRTTKFIMANPVAALGALTAALVGVGIKATLMAAETDTALRKIGAVLPDAAGKFGQVRQAVDELSRSSGIAEDQLLATAQTIARNGVASTEELLLRLRVVQEAADATGADMNTLAVGLDQVLDAFGLSGDKFEEVAAKLRAAGQGKEPIEDLLGAIQAAAPALREAGLDFDVGASAIARFVAEGLNAKQAGKALRDLLAQGGPAVRAFAGDAINGAKALNDLHAAAALVGESAERNAARLRETLSGELRDLGTKILPLVNAELGGILGILQLLGGEVDKIKAGSDLATVLTLSKLKLGADDAQRLHEAIRGLANAARGGNLDLTGLSPAQLTQLQGIVQGLTNLGTAGFLQPLAAAIAAQQGHPAAPLTGGRTPPPPGPTPEQVSAAKQFAEEIQAQVIKLQAGVAAEAIIALNKFAGELDKTSNTLTERQRKEAATMLANLRGQLQAALIGQATSAQVDAASRLGPEQGRDILTSLRQNLVDRLGPDETSALNLGLRQQIHDVDAAIAKVNLDLVAAYQAQADATGEVLDNTSGIADAAKEAAKDAEREASAREKAKQHALNLSRQIEQAARGGLQLAEAFGLLNANAAKALANVAQIGAAIPGILLGDPTSILSGVGGLVSLISGLFAPNAEDQAAAKSREIQQANTDALKALTSAFDSFASTLTGTQQTTAQSGISALLNARGGILDPTKPQSGALDFSRIDTILGGVGTSLADLENLAKSFHITLDTSNAAAFTESLKQLQTALQDADRIRFLDSFTGQMDALNARFQLLNITDPVEKLKEIMAVLTDLPHQVKITNPDGTTQLVNAGHGSPAIAGALAGLDLGKASDRAKALDKLTELLDELTRGQINAAGLGDLTAEQFKQELLDLGGLIRDANAQIGGQSSSFAVDRTITEITGSRIAAILDKGLFYQQNLTTLPEIRDLLAAALAGALLAPPAWPAGSPGLAGAQIVVQAGAFPLTIQMPAGGDPVAIGQAVGQAQGQALDTYLAQRAGAKQATRGGVLQ